MTEPAVLAPGTVFGSYRIDRLLGRGGMGAVYSAEQLEDGRQVAVKVLTTGLGSDEDRQRFIREGHTAASINHPNTVYVYRTEEINGLPTITMELVEGGTLEDKVTRLGPLSVAEAITDILQIIDGLQAAQRLGILHRDVKPANCFVAPGGEVKVGDFGLSRPVDQVDNARLTKTGLFLGTPVYSSPEQLMGEALDVRSDIYAVAATLYYLLSGKLPFDADNAVRLIAVVMSGTPTPLIKHRPDVPEALNALVMRCLARKREERFANYDELREALIACQPAQMVPAPILRRFVAGVADSYAISLISTPLFVAVGGSLGVSINDLTRVSDNVTTSAMSAKAALLQLAIAVPLEVVWYGLLEGRLGWSPGKLLLGLRVARVEGGPPGFWRGLVRSLAVILPGLVSVLVSLPISNPITKAYTLQAVFLLVLIGLFARARRANGYAAEHDRITGTRVVKHRKIRAPQRTMHVTGEMASVPATTGARIGPYQVVEPVASNADVIEGFDPDLRRAVWIVRHPEGTPAVPAAQRQMVRVGCLRWIGGKREGTDAWDAYAAVQGRPLRSLLAGSTSWDDVHHWMKDLVDELRARQSTGTELAGLSLDHVWISNEGRAIVLPFAHGADGHTPPPGDSLLQQYAAAVLGGEGSNTQRDSWPLRARSLLQHARSTTDLDALHTMLGDASENTAAMSRRRRVTLWAAITVPTVLFSALTIGIMMVTAPSDSDQLRIEPLLGYVADKDNQADSLAHTRNLVGVYVAGHFREVITTADRKRVAGASGAVLSKKEWDRADSILQAHPTVDAALLREADQLVDSTWQGKPPGEMSGRALVPFFAFLGFLFFVMVFSLLAALFARRGLAMRLLGLELVNRRGEPAGRLRLLWRQLVVLGPLALMTVAALAFLNAKPSLPKTALGVAAFVLVIASIVTALRTPDRGLTERLSGTRMVPE